MARGGSAPGIGRAVGPPRVVAARTATGVVVVARVGGGAWRLPLVRGQSGPPPRAWATGAAPAAVADRARPPVRAPASNGRPVAVGAGRRPIEARPAERHRAVAPPVGEVTAFGVVGVAARVASQTARPTVAAVSSLGAEGRTPGARAPVSGPPAPLTRQALGPVPVAATAARPGTAAVGASSGAG